MVFDISDGGPRFARLVAGVDGSSRADGSAAVPEDDPDTSAAVAVTLSLFPASVPAGVAVELLRCEATDDPVAAIAVPASSTVDVGPVTLAGDAAAFECRGRVELPCGTASFTLTYTVSAPTAAMWTVMTKTDDDADPASTSRDARAAVAASVDAPSWTVVDTRHCVVGELQCRAAVPVPPQCRHVTLLWRGVGVAAVRDVSLQHDSPAATGFVLTAVGCHANTAVDLWLTSPLGHRVACTRVLPYRWCRVSVGSCGPLVVMTVDGVAVRAQATGPELHVPRACSLSIGRGATKATGWFCADVTVGVWADAAGETACPLTWPPSATAAPLLTQAPLSTVVEVSGALLEPLVSETAGI
jgi:hypothetical protein